MWAFQQSRSKLKLRQKKTQPKLSGTAYLIIVVLALSLLLVAFAVPVASGLRDMKHIKCNGTSCTWDVKNIAIVVSYSIVKAVVLVSDSCMHVIFVVVFFKSVKEWKIYEIDEHWKCVNQKIDAKYFCLYNCNYMHVGERTKLETEAFARWFVLKFFIFFVLSAISFVQIIRFGFRKETGDWLDITHSVLYLLYSLVSSLVLYVTAL